MRYGISGYRNCAGITAKGKPCRNSGTCHVHRKVNEARLRESVKAEMAELFKRCKPQQLQMIEAELVDNQFAADYICGCQG